MSDVVLDAARANLRAELDNGPDARSPVPGACPLCGEALFFSQAVLWRYYPDMNHYSVWCEDCAYRQEVDL